jgi:hypothetical protein
MRRQQAPKTVRQNRDQKDLVAQKQHRAQLMAATPLAQV